MIYFKIQFLSMLLTKVKNIHHFDKLLNLYFQKLVVICSHHKRIYGPIEKQYFS